ncbi:MAG: hypothetical protein DYH15_14515, partial [Nitrosomonas sp. PRO4]|nr:hypothetical protein [Nitrosomonas sp. PRO4]
MKKTRWLFMVFTFAASLLATPIFAEGDGGDGDSDGSGDMDGDYSNDDHDGERNYHHHDSIHDHLIIGAGGFYNPWFWGGYYGPGIWRSYYGSGIWSPYGYREYGYGFGAPFYPPYSSYPPVVTIPAQPPVYIQQLDINRSQPRSGYWYYCKEPQGYYPYVKECPAGWLQVAPQ